MAFSVSTNVYESNVNVNNNTSDVTLVVTLNSTYGSYFSDNKTGTLTIDGTNYNITYNFPSGTSSKELGRATKTITHNNDGSKSVNWSYSLPTNSSQGTKTGSGSIGLTTIARASQPSCITYPNTTQNIGNVGDTITIHMNRKSTSFTHKVTYSLGSQSGTIATNVGDNCSWTIPLNLANSITNAKSGNGTIYAETFNGSTSIGTKSVNFVVNVPNTSTFKPTISLSATGSNLFNNKYLNKVSGVTIAATRNTKYGASVSSYIITGGSKSSTNASLVVNPINISINSASTNVTVNGTVTDSRGYQGTGSTSVTVYRYNVPQITEYSIARCTSDGTLATNGTYAKVSLKYTYQNDGYSNSMSVHKVNINGADTTITTTETTSSGVVTGTGTAVVGGGNLAVNNHYSYTITCTDAVGKSTNVSGILQTASRIINVRPGGLGISFGKFAETDSLVDSAWNIKAPNFQGTATNATNTAVTNTNPSSGTWYYPTFVDGTSGNKAQLANNGLRYHTNEGTTSAVGTSYLSLGNSTASGTTGNKKAFLQMYGQNTGRAQISYANSTSNVDQTLPALSGTFCVKQSATIATETNGWYKVNMGAFTLYFKNGDTASQSFAANSWSTINMNLPSGITYNDAKMLLFGNAKGRDNAIRVSFCVFSGGTQLQFSWHNASSGAITTQIRYNVGLIVFP